MTATEEPVNWRVLFDLNVVLDVLMRREPHFTDSARLWALVESKQVVGFIAAHSFTTLFSLYKRQSKPETAYQAIRKLLYVFEVAGVNRQIIELASDLAWPDFEDAVQAMAASRAGCDYLVTRNLTDYTNLRLAVIQPADFLAVWAAREAN